MTRDLKAAFDDLVRSGPQDAELAALARRAWTTGRRRRRNRIVAAVAAIVMVLGGVGLVTALGPLHRAPIEPSQHPAGTSTDSGGYPERVTNEWFAPTLPAKPGAMAMVVESGMSDPTWYAVSPEGRYWKVPTTSTEGASPSLSPTGTEIGYLATDFGPYVIHNLVTGTYQRFPTVASGIGSAHAEIWTELQSPTYWSADGRWVELLGGRRGAGETGRYVILGTDGSARVLDDTRALSSTFAAGWIGDELAVLAPSDERFGSARRAAIELVDVDGTVTRTLQIDAPFEPSRVDQWSAVLSPDGQRVLLVEQNTFNVSFVRWYSLTTGQRLGGVQVGNLNQTCGSTWANSTPVVPVDYPADSSNPDVAPAGVTASGVRRIVAIDPRLSAQCTVWATNALAGPRHDSLFGLSSSPLTWWWREVVAALLVLLVALAAVVRVRYVRRTRLPDFPL